VKATIVFDMDGVLVDVSESYRETIRLTIRQFTGTTVTHEFIQELKNQGGFNDDWKLCYHVIRTAGVDVQFQDVVDYFQGIFLGTNGHEPLIRREKWVARDGLFDRLRQDYRLAVFTGRLRSEAYLTLDRFARGLFDPVVGSDDVERLKPAPDGLVKIRSMFPQSELLYLGDTVDDARSAAAATVPFVGIAPPGKPRYEETAELLNREGAIAVLDDINQLEGVLEKCGRRP
jgi:HAD superfamily phosphatase